jgi:hypothetical protein
VHPGPGGVGADELEAERPESAATRHLDRLELAAGDPQRRMRPRCLPEGPGRTYRLWRVLYRA